MRPDFVKSWALIEASGAAARRERAEYIYCLGVRAGRWFVELLTGKPALGPCCNPA